mmetsp:Transcript_15054/g.34904  ORF Transcript_15054/g.34904 Transcript_15054/m.34904 type:complete len:240 (+) Transcript_15054:160-879(+)|eukprot:CAMPEP_0197184252 /NCGR_PEP_ID=MMETSP1423-20130617/9537_1 /TAXON_ID=476441 /ORGANISM="Pseudo-nitzschia heimii, Strain UNC1101" /LENGTH=239 /DNA_ID=CAMNT_0042635029 /DNA_START=122 /DNA_END=841 /DNA_ORIENTATION=-
MIDVTPNPVALESIVKEGDEESKVEEPIDKVLASEDSEEEIDDHPTSVIVTLPKWTTQFYRQRKKKVYKTEEEMMEVAMELSKINCERNTGGPFGTAIFEHDPKTKESKLFTVGVNRVVPCSNSTLHGEMTAIQFGQQKIGSFSFNDAGARKSREYHLYTSCAPCCQCLGGVMWSGVSKLVCGANKADAEAIGFDEGPVFDQSYVALEQAGCTVVKDVLRDECKSVLDWYGSNGEIYNP